MTINFRFVWEKNNFLSKTRDIKWFCTQALLEDMVWVAHGDHHRRWDQRYLWPGQLQGNLTNKISRVAAAVDGGLGVCTDSWKARFKTWTKFLRAFSSQGLKPCKDWDSLAALENTLAPWSVFSSKELPQIFHFLFACILPSGTMRSVGALLHPPS